MKRIIAFTSLLGGFAAAAQGQDTNVHDQVASRTQAPVFAASAPNFPNEQHAQAARRRLVASDRPRAQLSGCAQGTRIASAYYAEGKHTASGQRFDPNGLTAAHRSFPFGTRVIVVNPRTGKSVTVTINDRGPFVRGVTLDLSLGAAKLIGMRGTGALCMAKVGSAS